MKKVEVLKKEVKRVRWIGGEYYDLTTTQFVVAKDGEVSSFIEGEINKEDLVNAGDIFGREFNNPLQLIKFLEEVGRNDI